MELSNIQLALDDIATCREYTYLGVNFDGSENDNSQIYQGIICIPYGEFKTVYENDQLETTKG